MAAACSSTADVDTPASQGGAGASAARDGGNPTGAGGGTAQGGSEPGVGGMTAVGGSDPGVGGMTAVGGSDPGAGGLGVCTSSPATLPRKEAWGLVAAGRYIDPKRVDAVGLLPEEATGNDGMAGAASTAGTAGASAEIAPGCPATVQTGFCATYSFESRVDVDTCAYTLFTGGCCGRPFVVDGTARRAPLTERGDWYEGNDTVNSPGRLDEALAAAWGSDGAMEHASVASFARFTLELLAFGAPAHLVGRAQAAGLDEVRHAMGCFALASRFSGRGVGPGPLTLGDCAPAGSLAAAAASAVAEGCVGETLAALRAAEQLTRATDPGVRQLLRSIAEDEAAHAELAWAFVAWAMGELDDAGRRHVVAAFDDAIDAARDEVPDEGDAASRLSAAGWNGAGRLTSAQARRCQLESLRDVIVPNAALLGAGSSSGLLAPAAAFSRQA